jgi:putative peptidoglycan lipid II flippase
MILTAVVVLFIVLAPLIVPLFQGKNTTDAMIDLAIPLSRVLFPIVLILGINGLVVGILQAYDHFTIPALSPVVWNLVIMFFMVAAQPLTATTDAAIYGYAIGVLIGTVVQLAMALPMLKRVGFEFAQSFDWRDERIKRVFKLIVPVALGLGLINFNALINTLLAGQISDQAVAGVDKAFRLYMLPQGMFSVAISTVLFPQLARLAARKDVTGLQDTIGVGMRLILLMLLPAMAAMIVLPTAITRLVYEGGKFNEADTALVSTALLFYSFSLVFSGMNLLLSRSFFSLQLPWAVTWLSLANLVVNLIASVLFLSFGFGIGGLVLGTAVADGAMVVGQIILLRRALGGQMQLGTMRDGIGALVLATGWFAAAAFGVYHGLDLLLGRSTLSQIISVGGGLAAGSLAYGYLVVLFEVPEARMLWARVAPRLGR